MTPAARAAVSAALGARIVRESRVAGGDINDAFRAELEDDRVVFVKTNERASAAMFPAEARGLAFLAEARAVRVPAVLAVSAGAAGAPGFLALEFLESGPRAPRFDERLGEALAALHRARPREFGLDHDNFIGRLPQSNRPRATWLEFFRDERLVPQLRAAEEAGLAPSRLLRACDRLFAKLGELVGPEEPPARLHGDLWGGNLHVAPDGEPVLIDPAVYGGHREMDLAMMRLFGGFSERTFAAYHAAHPLAPGHEERVPLYQLYPLLVHVNLFGGSYVSSAMRALASYV